MRSRQVWIGTSWKMNKTLAEARAFAEGLLADPAGDPRIQRFLMPPFTAVREVKAMLQDTSVLVGAQNMHWADDGAWTGEISPPMLRDCGLDMVEIGHSERRAHFGETNEVTSIRFTPASTSLLINAILSPVAIKSCSFCSPSRGPTSTISIASGH